ncbi:MAG TPA: ferrochelatase [Coriobacteriia bacterium]
MGFAPWEIVLIAGVAGGATTCAALVAPRRRLVWIGLAGSAAAALLALGIGGVWRLTTRADATVVVGLVGLGASLGGYALCAALLPTLTRPRMVSPALVTAPDDGTAHVILLADAEHDTYRPGDVTRALELYERLEVPMPPYLARPLVYASERSRYRRASGSPARRAVREVAAALATHPQDESPYAVETAFCNGGPSLAEVVAALAARGGRRIIVVAMTVARTRAFDSAIGDAQSLALSRAGIEMIVTDPLWASSGVASAAARRALAVFSGHGRENGVVLVAEGSPWQWDRQYPAATEQSTFFAQRLRAELIERGLPAERIRQAWLDWEQPDVPEAVRHLAALGATRIALVPVDLLVENLASAVDLPQAAEQAAFETAIRIEVVSPLGDDPALISALLRQIARASLNLEGLAGDPDL